MSLASELTALVVGRALAFDAASKETMRLRRERAACRCEVAEPPEPEVGSEGVGPCWKQWEEDFEDDGVVSRRRPQGEWCETCRRRQQLHDAYCASLPKTAGAKRSLHLACEKLRKVEVTAGAGHA